MNEQPTYRHGQRVEWLYESRRFGTRPRWVPARVVKVNPTRIYILAELAPGKPTRRYTSPDRLRPASVTAGPTPRAIAPAISTSPK